LIYCRLLDARRTAIAGLFPVTGLALLRGVDTEASRL
jgi:hypothetical protein